MNPFIRSQYQKSFGLGLRGTRNFCGSSRPGASRLRAARSGRIMEQTGCFTQKNRDAARTGKEAGDGMKKLPLLIELLLTFMKIGLFTFGGGYAMIPMMENHCVEKKQWITHEEMMDVTVIAESTPGPIAINCATYVGYRQRGFKGALIATLGMVLPSFAIIFLISLFLDNFLEIAWIARAFKGIKIAVGLLIFDAALTMLKKMPKKALPRVIVACACALMLAINIFSWNFSSIGLMLIAG